MTKDDLKELFVFFVFIALIAVAGFSIIGSIALVLSWKP